MTAVRGGWDDRLARRLIQLEDDASTTGTQAMGGEYVDVEVVWPYAGPPGCSITPWGTELESGLLTNGSAAHWQFNWLELAADNELDAMGNEVSVGNQAVVGECWSRMGLDRSR